MRFSVDPWDPSYGASLDTELGASSRRGRRRTSSVPAARVGAGRPDAGRRPPAAVLFVDGVRRIDAQVWVDESGRRGAPRRCARPTPRASCAAAASGGAHLARGRGPARPGHDGARRAPTSITPAGTYAPRPRRARARTSPRCRCCRLALQRGRWARSSCSPRPSARGGHGDRGRSARRRRAAARAPHLPRAIGFVKSHRSDYLPPQLGAVVAAAARRRSAPRCSARASDRGSATPGTCGCRAAPGAPWAGIVRVECGADLAPAWRSRSRRRSQATLAAVRLHGVQGLPRAAEPLPDRRAGTGAAPATRRARAALPGAAAGGRAAATPVG